MTTQLEWHRPAGTALLRPSRPLPAWPQQPQPSTKAALAGYCIMTAGDFLLSLTGDYMCAKQTRHSAALL